MPYNIVLDPDQSYSPSSNNNPNLQDWAFNPSPISVSHSIGEAAPASIVVSTTIRDYLAEDLSGDFIYYIKNRVGVPVTNEQVPDLISLSGVISSATGDGYMLSTTNTNVDVTLSFINMQVVPPGQYVIPIIFEVYRKDINDIVSIFGFRSFNVTINVFDGIPFSVTPENLTLVYVKGSGGSANQNLVITATGAFTVLVKPYITLSGGNLVDGGLTSAGDFREYTGLDSQTIVASANTLLESYAQGFYNELAFFTATDVNFNPILLRTIVFDTDEAVIVPEQLEFFAVRGFSEAEPQVLNIVSPYAFTITAPSWLTVSPNSGTYELNASVLPILAQNLSAGVYEGIIAITANSIEYTVAVTYTITDTVQLGMDEDAINFTDDFATITRFFNQPEYKINLKLTIKYYQYNTDVSQTKVLAYKLALFNSRTEFFVGRTLNNIMAELEALSQTPISILSVIESQDNTVFNAYYKPSEINLQVDFIHANDELLNRSITYQDIKFLKGRKPIKVFPNTAVLNYYAEPLRVTPKSFVFFNFYKTENHGIRIYKNGILDNVKGHAVGNDSVWLFKYQMNNCAPGDVVEIRIYKMVSGAIDSDFYDNAANYVSQKYIVFPEGKRSYHVAWENEHGVLDLMEFTGDISYNMGYENNIVKNYRDFKEYLRKIDSRRTQSVVINTGFVLQENPKRLDSLLNAKRAWIMYENEPAIALVPDTKSLANYDSDQGLYAYDVEFQINLNNDYKVNS